MYSFYMRICIILLDDARIFSFSVGSLIWVISLMLAVNPAPL